MRKIICTLRTCCITDVECRVSSGGCNSQRQLFGCSARRRFAAYAWLQGADTHTHTHTLSLTHSMHNYAGFYVANTYACTMYVCVGVCICAAVGKWFVGNGEPDIDGSLNWLHRTSANIVDLWTFAIGAANARRPASKWRADATAETCYMWQIGKTTNFADQCHWLWELNRSRWNSFDLCLRDLPKK